MENLKKKMAVRMVSLVDELATCDCKDMSNVFRQLNEAIQEYCTFVTLVNKYSSEKENEKA